MPTRRSLLVTGGAASALVIVGASWTLTRAPKLARAPWSTAGSSLGDPRLDVLAYAILAPNPHNMQPWVIELEGENDFRVFANPARLLPETDPHGRQITIGFGCFIELLNQAAAEKGYRTEISPFPEGSDEARLDDRPIASVRMIADPTVRPDPLFDTILIRRTNRLAFDLTKDVSDADLKALLATASDGLISGASNQPEMVSKLRTLTKTAWETEWNNPATRMESIEVTRLGKAENNENPWGLSLSGPLMETLAGTGLLSREKMNDPESTSYAQSLEFYNKACNTAMAHVWTVSRMNTREDQLAAGRTWVRIQQECTKRGIAFHPLSQALQEFPAMAPHYKTAHELLAPEGGIVQMLSRLGYAKAPPPAPREPLTAKLITMPSST